MALFICIMGFSRDIRVIFSHIIMKIPIRWRCEGLTAVEGLKVSEVALEVTEAWFFHGFPRAIAWGC